MNLIGNVSIDKVLYHVCIGINYRIHVVHVWLGVGGTDCVHCRRWWWLAGLEVNETVAGHRSSSVELGVCIVIAIDYVKGSVLRNRLWKAAHISWHG